MISTERASHHPRGDFDLSIKKSCLRLVYKPHSVQQRKPVYTRRLLPGALPGRSSFCAVYPELKEGEQPPVCRSRHHPCLALLPVGVAWPPALLQTPVVSYTTFSPLPLAWRSVSVALSSRLPRSGFSPAPCSLEYGLSSMPPKQHRDRPTSLRHFHHNPLPGWRQLPGWSSKMTIKVKVGLDIYPKTSKIDMN